MHTTRTRALAPWLAAGVILAAGAVAVLSVAAGATPYHQVGNADPGVVVAVGAPLLRLFADLCAAVTIGSLAFAAFCTRPQPSGLLASAGYGEVRIATGAAALWCGCAVLLVPFSAADTAGTTLGDALVPSRLAGLIDAAEQPEAWLVTAIVAGLVAVGCRATLRWQSAVTFLALAVLAVMPVTVTGHGSSDTNHDLALAALVVHVPVAVLWLGLLLTVLRRRETRLHAAYRRVTWWCWWTLVGTGIVLAAVIVPPAQVPTTAYGRVLVAKLVVVAVLGFGAWRLRARGRFLAAELVLLAGVVGASVELSHLQIPDFLSRAIDTQQAMLGFHLAGPPTVVRLLLDWRPDLFFGPLAVLLAVTYLVKARGRDWPPARTASWLAGCAVLLLATSSGVGRYEAAMFSMHQLSHMLYSMLVPALLVMGAPLTLFGIRPAYRPLRALTHPLVALALFAGSPFAVYFTGLFDAAARFSWAHALIEAWFLAVGYLFCWPLIGTDPTPRPLPNLARVGLLLAAMPADILFGAALINTHRVIGNGVAADNMYQALRLPWVNDLLADQRHAGIIAIVVSELTLFVMLAALLLRWQRVDDQSMPALVELPQPQAVGHHEQ